MTKKKIDKQKITKIADSIRRSKRAEPELVISDVIKKSKKNKPKGLIASFGFGENEYPDEIGYKIWKSTKKDKLLVIKDVLPDIKIAEKDINKEMTKKDILNEVVSTVVGLLCKNKSESKNLIKNLKKSL